MGNKVQCRNNYVLHYTQYTKLELYNSDFFYKQYNCDLFMYVRLKWYMIGPLPIRGEVHVVLVEGERKGNNGMS